MLSKQLSEEDAQLKETLIFNRRYLHSHDGTAANAIPDTAVMGESFRTYDEEAGSYMKERMVQLNQQAQKILHMSARMYRPLC